MNIRAQKLKAEADLKMLDLKMITLHKELEILKDFEKQDLILAEKLQAQIFSKILMFQRPSAQKRQLLVLKLTNIK